MMPKHYNQYKAKSAAWKKAKKEHDEAVRKRKAVSTRLMSLPTKQGTEKGGRKETYPGAGPERKRRESTARKIKIITKGNKAGVFVGEKQWAEWLKFSKRKRSDNKI